MDDTFFPDEADELDLEHHEPERDEHLAESTPDLLRRIDHLLNANFGFRRAAEKVREFPQSPVVYLMKDVAGCGIYVGKAKNLRALAGS